MFHVSGHLKEGESLQSCGAEDGGLWLIDVGAILLILRQHSARLSPLFLRFIMLRSFSLSGTHTSSRYVKSSEAKFWSFAGSTLRSC